MKWLERLLPIIFLSLAVLACLEPYTPPVSTENQNVLVVDAFLNSSNGIATVKLTRTTPLLSADAPPFESGALVTIHDDQGSTITLQSQANGLYTAQFLKLDLQRKYQLHIRTAGGTEYQSDFVELRRTPLIDSVNFFVDNEDLLNVNVNTHDPTGQSRYYKWNFVETYEYQSPLISAFLFESAGKFRPREPYEFVNRCWKTQQLLNINIGTTNRLSTDIVSNHNLLKIPRGALKISVRYSILVQQQTLTEGAYTYWLNVQKTTESLGGLFDPMPAQVIGNIHCITDPAQKVVGYFSGGEITEKRIFIEPSMLPRNFAVYTNRNCLVDSVMLDELHLMSPVDNIVNPIYNQMGPPTVIGFTVGSKSCTDCRDFVAGGVLERPHFW
jgi:hypothetical protein